MRVLWITNILFPEAKALVTGGDKQQLDSGGWMLGAANALMKQEGLTLCVATVSRLVRSLTRLNGECISYYILPYGKGNNIENKEYIPYWKEVNEEFKPDVVHIHGTEFSHGLAFVEGCGADNVVVSIQGLTSACYKYYHSGISSFQLIKNMTIRDFFKGGTLSIDKVFKKKSAYEKIMIQKIHHIIGRTSWDRAHTWAINPNAEYHVGNETLRDEFYNGRWNYDDCERHSIFFSQVSSPLKGFHIFLQAAPLILREYPDLKLRIAGSDLTHRGSFKERLKLSDYGRIIKKMIRESGMENRITFTGPLTASQMKREYLRANVFVSSSSIENSPNSLGEAQLLGVPCVASYVGGTMDMIPNNSCGVLYRFEEVDMLAYKICKIFKDSSTLDNREMIEEANRRHNPMTNLSQLLDTYHHIIRRNENKDIRG